MTYIIEQNGLRYDDTDPNCQLILTRSKVTCIENQNELIVAFVTVLDIKTGKYKRFWGALNMMFQDESIKEIMKYGSKWPIQFQIIPLAGKGVLYE